MGMSEMRILALALLLAFVSVVTSTPALRIMPLGDSITQWHCGHQARVPATAADTASFGGYRGFLFSELERKWGGYKFETVGSEYGCGSHEGHSGWTCEDLAGIITRSAETYRPDVVLLMCGTNDFYCESDLRCCLSI
jgi:hypothetical protein